MQVYNALSLSGVLLLVACPENPLKNAYQARDIGQLDKAGYLFLNAARRDPANLAAWDGAVSIFCEKKVHVGRCLEVLDLELDLLGSIERHQDALSISLESRAQARLESGLPRAALDDLNRATEVAPDRAEVALLQAKALIMLGKREAALDAIERAFALKPTLKDINQVRAMIPAPLSVQESTDEGFGGRAPEP